MLNLNFKENIVLIGNGLCDKKTILNYSKNFKIIAVDGGLRHCIKNNINPLYVLGDMDSAKQKHIQRYKIKIIKLSDQNSTDFEKAISNVSAPLIYCLGFLGNRFDHSLAAINVLSKYHRKKNILLIGKKDVLAVFSNSIFFNLPINSRISIWPINELKVKKSTGLKWSLSNLVMKPENKIGTSNSTVEREVNIFLDKDNKGQYLIIVNKKNTAYIEDIFKKNYILP